jgi:hypothetical protein
VPQANDQYDSGDKIFFDQRHDLINMARATRILWVNALPQNPGKLIKLNACPLPPDRLEWI